MAERILRANGVELCVETFGTATDPAVLLVMGAAGSMDYWEAEFCARLAAGRRHVIRYDLRDTGRSVTSEPGRPPYTFSDLVDDAVGLLDALGISAAHLVGVSMGGAIAQCVALRYPDRTASLTLISTAPAVEVDRELPPLPEEMRAVFDSPLPAPDWADREAVIDYLVEVERPFLGPVHGDDAHKRAVASRMAERTANLAASQANHWILDDGDPVPGRLADIGAATLVVHGTEDPLLPYPNAEILADEIPAARLLPLAGVGHEVPPRQTWDVVIPALIEHTGAIR